MKVVLPNGESIEIGDVEATPTIGITDYSRRVTDDFGVTTVVERGFARRMSVRLAVPFDAVDALQRRLADLRATPVLWVADDRLDSLSVRGFYKDFSLDLSVPPVSFCTLTVEGLVATDPFIDNGDDPAPTGQASTLQLLRPTIVTDAVLTASSVGETDQPEWSPVTSYALGDKVMRATTHRVYESVAANNAGADPAGNSGKWLDLGPTNRWSMFDQALGTITAAQGSITVTLGAGNVDALALLDTVAASVRVEAAGYDRTLVAGGGTITFLDLPSPTGQIVVTITGDGVVSVGTLLVGRLEPLGITEASPTAGITDYSRKEVDDFGDVTVVQRAWSKRMTANALIRTGSVDLVAGRIAAARAQPSLWIGQAGLDSLTVYGFFKDFSIEVGENVSKLSLSIEGFSAAAKVEPLDTSVDWPDVGDPDGTKPDDNATEGAPGDSPIGGVQQPDGTIVGSRPANSIVVQVDKALADIDDLIEKIDGIAGADLEAIEAIKQAVEAARDVVIVARDATLEARDAADADALIAAQRAGDANNYAVTAQGASTIASQKADESGASAALSSAKADIATTKAGEASVHEANALTSEQNSAGSAVLAATFQEVAARSAGESGRLATGNLVRKPNFEDNSFAGWEYDSSRNLIGTDTSGVIGDGYTHYLRSYARDMCAYTPVNRGITGTFKNRWFRVRARISALDSQYPVGFGFLGYGGPNAEDQYGSVRTIPAGTTWTTLDYNVLVTDDVTSINPWLWIAGPPGTGSSSCLAWASIEDITDSKASADGASASGVSASTASIKAGEAGISAAAARQDRLDAEAANAGALANAGSARQDAAVATGQAAAASQAANLSAQFQSGAGGMLNRNATFSRWSDPTALPELWAYSAGFGIGPNLSRVAGKVGPYALRSVQGGQANQYIATNGLGGFDSAIDPGLAKLGPGQYVLDADFEVEAGGLSGGGMYAAAFSDQNVNVGVWQFEFGSTADANGVVNGVGVAGRRYRFTKMFNASDPRTFHFRLHPMTSWTGFGAGVDKTIVWHSFGIRRATPGEIEAGRADANVTLALARIEEVNSVAASAQSAAANVSQQLTARSGGGGNLLANSTFTTSDGWVAYNAVPNAQFNHAINVAGDNWHPVEENVLGVYQSNRSGVPSQYMGWFSPPAVVIPGRYIQFYGFSASHRAVRQAVLYFYNAGQIVGEPVHTSAIYSGENGGRNGANYTQQGVASILVPAGAEYAILEFRKFDTNEGQADSYAWWWRPYIGEARQGQTEFNPYSPGSGSTIAAATLAAIANQGSVFAGQTSALAQQISGTETRVGGLESRTSITETSVGDLLSKSSAARIEFKAISAGGAVEVDFFSSLAGGAGIRFGSPLSTFTGKLAVGNGMGAEMQITNELIQKLDGNGNWIFQLGTWS